MLVSIIIPCYNVQDYIGECVESVYFQTYLNIEVICIDNNSTDKTRIKLTELQAKYPSLVVGEELTPGAPAARNKGLKFAKGDWIQFLDADDLLLPTKISNQIELLDANQDVNFIVGDYLKRNLMGEDISITYPKGTNPFLSLMTSQLGNTCSNMFNYKMLKESQGWDENYNSSQEAKLMFELLKVNSTIIYDNKKLTIIRERESGQISQSNPTKKWLQYVDLRVEMIDYIKINFPKIYIKNKGKVQQILFDNIRVLAKYDLQDADQIFKTNFSKSFRPLNMDGKKSFYAFLFNILGFTKTEKLYRLMH